ncbi:MAG: hypothetical protein PHF21_02375 [Bacilli bacterium]|nr:hypothetical protein [Bacilli bacterium]
MENKLKKLDSSLYLLCNHDINKNYNILERFLKFYKTDDQIITEFIKQLNNKNILDSIGEFQRIHLLDLANKRLNDATELIRSLIRIKNYDNFVFLMEFINLRLKTNFHENLKILINELLNIEEYLKLIEDIIDNQDLSLPVSVNSLINIILKSDKKESFYLIEKVLYSKKVNHLEVFTLKRAVLYLSNLKKDNYEEILEEITLKYVDNLELLTSLKNDLLNSKNKNAKNQAGVIDIYHTFYTNNGEINKPKTRKIVRQPELKLSKYNEDVLKSFVDSLDSSYINKVGYLNSSFDVMSGMLHINRPCRAEDVFIKSSYRPINKAKRKKELTSNHETKDEFALRLNANINLCLYNGYYDLLQTIISAKKIDSINIKVLYDLVVDMVYGVEDLLEESKVCANIIDIILYKISEDKLMVYRTSPLKENSNKNKHVLSKEGSLKFINLITSNPEIKLTSALDQVQNTWTTLKK